VQQCCHVYDAHCDSAQQRTQRKIYLCLLQYIDPTNLQDHTSKTLRTFILPAGSSFAELFGYYALNLVLLAQAAGSAQFALKVVSYKFYHGIQDA